MSDFERLGSNTIRLFRHSQCQLPASCQMSISSTCSPPTHHLDSLTLLSIESFVCSPRMSGLTARPEKENHKVYAWADSSPVVRVFHTYCQVVALLCWLHGWRVQHSGSKKGELCCFLVRQERNRSCSRHQPWIWCENPCRSHTKLGTVLEKDPTDCPVVCSAAGQKPMRWQIRPLKWLQISLQCPWDIIVWVAKWKTRDGSSHWPVIIGHCWLQRSWDHQAAYNGAFQHMRWCGEEWAQQHTVYVFPDLHLAQAQCRAYDCGR